VDGRRNLREWPAVCLLALVLALVMTAPVALHIGSRVPDSLGDPLLQAWQVAWDGHAVLHAPLHLFDAKAFWPAHDSLAFSDPLLGYAPAGAIGTGPAAALVRYNLEQRFVDSTYMYWSTDGFPRIVNGWSGFEPSVLTRVRAATRAFPAGAGGRPLLLRLGVR
jgi:hypothetical protein